MIDLYCPHCGFELTEAEIRRFTASLNGRRPKKRKNVKSVAAAIEGVNKMLDSWPKEPIKSYTHPVMVKTVKPGAVCVHGRVRSLCLACERRNK